MAAGLQLRYPTALNLPSEARGSQTSSGTETRVGHEDGVSIDRRIFRRFRRGCAPSTASSDPASQVAASPPEGSAPIEAPEPAVTIGNQPWWEEAFKGRVGTANDCWWEHAFACDPQPENQESEAPHEWPPQLPATGIVEPFVTAGESSWRGPNSGGRPVCHLPSDGESSVLQTSSRSQSVPGRGLETWQWEEQAPCEFAEAFAAATKATSKSMWRWQPPPRRRPPKCDPVSRGAQVRAQWARDGRQSASRRTKLNFHHGCSWTAPAPSPRRRAAPLLIPTYVPPHEKRRDLVRAQVRQRMLCPDFV